MGMSLLTRDEIALLGNVAAFQTDASEEEGHAGGSPVKEETEEAIQAREQKDKDLRIALCIAGYAGLPTRDRHGNVVPEVWTQHGRTEEVSTQLIDVATVRGLLQEQLRAHMDARREMLLDLDDPAVVAKWVIDFTTKWELEYRKKVESKWDVSQTILTAMADTVDEVREVFDATSAGVTMATMRDAVENMYKKHKDKKEKMYQSKHDALVRALFRSEHVGPFLARIAGKILQKRLVCNKAGMYSARVQRNDVTRERDDAIEALVQAHFDDSPIFSALKKEFDLDTKRPEYNQLHKQCLDHTQVESSTR